MLKSSHDESGAVTVDWVVLVAAIVLMAGTAVGVVMSGVETAGGVAMKNAETQAEESSSQHDYSTTTSSR